jgi:hypothetical protein
LPATPISATATAVSTSWLDRRFLRNVSAVVSAILPLVLRSNLTPLATVKRMQAATARASLGHRPFPPEPAA